MDNYIPPTFTRGILFTLFYFFIFLGFIYSWVVKNRRSSQIPGSQKEKKNLKVDKMTVGKSYFAIFEDEKESSMFDFVEGGNSVMEMFN